MQSTLVLLWQPVIQSILVLASLFAPPKADPGILWGVPQQPVTYPGSRDDDHQWLGFNVHGDGKKVHSLNVLSKL